MWVGGWWGRVGRATCLGGSGGWGRGWGCRWEVWGGVGLGGWEQGLVGGSGGGVRWEGDRWELVGWEGGG